jgi:hypothetical protein
MPVTWDDVLSYFPPYRAGKAIYKGMRWVAAQRTRGLAWRRAAGHFVAARAGRAGAPRYRRARSWVPARRYRTFRTRRSGW